MIAAAPSDHMIRKIGGKLVGREIATVTTTRPGGNNRVYCIRSVDAELFALKFYPSQTADRRDRLGQEFAALSFLTRHDVARVAKPIAVDRESNCAAYEWIVGARPSEPASAEDVDQLARFLLELQNLRNSKDATTLPPASASFFSPAGAVAQFELRFRNLRESACASAYLIQFLDRELLPTAREVIARFLSELARLQVDPDAELAPSLRALSPSDFGLHNALRSDDGTLIFLDFEYFGWDDPVKMVCDASLHPGNQLSSSLRERLFMALLPIFSESDPNFTVRCRLLYPLLGMVWCLIILNEFLPERWSRRHVAGQAGELSEIHAHQLEKARQLHRSVVENLDCIVPF
jgi:hypothetical protein